MNNRHRSEHSISQVELERLIEQYFDCELSSEQEQWLLHELSVTTLSSEAIDEARFAMGYMSVARKVHGSRGSGHKRLPAMLSVAASIVLILAVGLAVQGVRSQSSGSNCYAYIEGQKVVDSQEVMSIIKGDLSEMGSAHDAIDSHVLNELSAMGNALP